MNSGIYTITNLVNNKIYVGYSKTLKNRIASHKRDLERLQHTNPILQNSYNKYGFNNFEFEILEYCEPKFLASQENYWCNLLNTHNRKFGYNMQSTNPNFLYEATRALKEIHRENYYKLNKLALYNKNKTPEHLAKVAKAKSIGIYQLDSKGVIIDKYESISLAAKTLNIAVTSISNTSNSNNKIAHGFYWAKEKEYVFLNKQDVIDAFKSKPYIKPGKSKNVTPLTQERINLIKESYKNGFSIQEIKIIASVSDATVKKFITDLIIL